VRENLGGLCRRHHRVKHSGAWTVHQHDDGIYERISTVTGRRSTTYPRANHRRLARDDDPPLEGSGEIETWERETLER